MNTEYIYWIDVVSKVDQIVSIGVILCLILLFIFCGLYLMTKAENVEKSDDRLYSINSYLSGIVYSMNDIKDYMHSISCILDPKSIFKNIDKTKGGQFVNIEISGEMINLSDNDKEKLQDMVESARYSIRSIEDYKKYIDSLIKNMVSDTEFFIKGIRILSVLLIILSLIHIFIPSKEAMESIVNTSYTINYDTTKGE